MTVADHSCQDLNDMIQDKRWELQDNFAGRYFAMRSAGLKDTQWCVTHRAFCNLCKGSDLEVAGMPCQPNSQAGKRLKEHDPRFACYVSWSMHHIRQRTPAII